MAGLAFAGCGGGGHSGSTRPGGNAAVATGSAPLVRGSPCPEAHGFECARLNVPLDHSGRVEGRLTLRVAVQRGPAPRGVLVALSGGPGQPGVPFAPRLAERLRAALSGWRLVMFDQRGTGGGALRCPALQRAMGTSDLTVPPPAAVRACARVLGSRRRFFTTADTVADLDALRSALGVNRIAL